ncbi:MAG: hypothetical protein WC752_00195 [Patescibacteria group bacterium]|jgi:hypothetical protein
MNHKGLSKLFIGILVGLAFFILVGGILCYPYFRTYILPLSKSEQDLTDVSGEQLSIPLEWNYNEEEYQQCINEISEAGDIKEEIIQISFNDSYDNIKNFLASINSQQKVNKDSFLEKLTLKVPSGKEVEIGCKLKSLDDSIIRITQIYFFQNSTSDLIAFSGSLLNNENSSNLNLENKNENASQNNNICFFLVETSKNCEYKRPLYPYSAVEDASSNDNKNIDVLSLMYESFAMIDTDNDGILNYIELIKHTDLNFADNKEILLQDMSSEYQLRDKDYDGLLDSAETMMGLEKDVDDTDNDGYKDGEELINGFNPNGLGNVEYQASTYQEWEKIH